MALPIHLSMHSNEQIINKKTIMKEETNQMKFWSGDFGKEYTDRNPSNTKEMEELCKKFYGLTRKELNEPFLKDIPKDARILEVGCNTGSQLQTLQDMGYTNLYGIELQWYAVETAKKGTKNINIIQGTSFDIPFKDQYFDMVFTSGVLIHINPTDLALAMKEIIRCSKKHIWGFEYFTNEITDINYRGNTGFLWKADYCKIYQENDPSLKVIKKELFPYVDQPELNDCMYLLQKS